MCSNSWVTVILVIECKIVLPNSPGKNHRIRSNPHLKGYLKYMVGGIRVSSGPGSFLFFRRPFFSPRILFSQLG